MRFRAFRRNNGQLTAGHSPDGPIFGVVSHSFIHRPNHLNFRPRDVLFRRLHASVPKCSSRPPIGRSGHFALLLSSAEDILLVLVSEFPANNGRIRSLSLAYGLFVRRSRSGHVVGDHVFGRLGAEGLGERVDSASPKSVLRGTQLRSNSPQIGCKSSGN